MKYRVLLAAIWAASTVLCGTGVVYADQTYTFLAAYDAWVNEANPTANYGVNTL